MEAAGWVFDWDDETDFLPLPGSAYCNGVSTTSYCGFSASGDGTLELTVTGTAALTVDFGNNAAQGTVFLLLDGAVLASATANTASTTHTFLVVSGGVVRLMETDATIVLNSISEGANRF
jgi:hypothetical protein